MMRRILIVAALVLAGQASAAFCSDIARMRYADIGLTALKTSRFELDPATSMNEILGYIPRAMKPGYKPITPWERGDLPYQGFPVYYATQTWAPASSKGPYVSVYIMAGPIAKEGKRPACFIEWDPAPRERRP